MARPRPLEDFIHDLRFASRQLLRDRGFTAVATLTLALGIGATTTLFTVLNAVVLNPLPFPQPDRLVDIATTWQGSPGAVSVGNYFLMMERSRTFQAAAARSSSTLNLTGEGEPERILGARVTANYFGVLGIGPALGRVFTQAEDAPGAAAVVVLSDGLFARRFGRDPAVVGRSLVLNGRAHTVLGVMPKAFEIPGDATELWTPIAFGPERSFDGHYLVVTARLKDGVTKPQIDADAAALRVAVLEAAPRNNDGRSIIVTRLLDRVVGDYRTRLGILLFAVSLVFLIACVNVASLLMARGAARSKEISVRAALGAGRFRIARQLMTEAMLLCALGAGAGLLLAAVALPIFIAQGPADVPRLAEARLDVSTLGIASLIALVATLIAGLVPALRESKAGLSSGAAQASRGSIGGVRDRVRQAFVAAEVALALMLLMGAGLLIRSAANLDQVSPGFDPRNLLTARLALPVAAYPGEEKPAAAVSRMVADLAASPGVAEAAASTRPPLIGDVSYGLRIEGREDTPQNRLDSRMQLVTPRYLETLRVNLRLGRAFMETDRRGGARVMIVSETLARLGWPGQSPIGKRVACCESENGEPVWKEVVGVVEDTKARGIAAAGLPEFYLPMDQAPRRAFEANGGSITLVLRATNGSPEGLTAIVRSVVKSVDPGVPLYDVATMASRVSASTALTRFNRLLLSCLGLVGLALSGIGIYGVIAYLVSQRTREIGLRLAIGAVPADVARLMMRQGAGAIGAGLVLGGLGVWAQGRAIESVLFGVSGRDPATFLGTLGVLLLVALAASLVPAWRASRIEPTRALSEP
jgi:putative ABC transport system permease protein